MSSTPTPPAAAIILAGGKSTRLGRDKASEVLAGKSLLQRAVDACVGLVDEIIIVTARDQLLTDLSAAVPIRVVTDVYADSGPLGGLFTGLQATHIPHALAIGCDTPLVNRALLFELLRRAPGFDAAAPQRDGRPEPLCAVYSKSCAKAARVRLERGNLKLTSLFDDLDTLLLPEAEWQRFDPEGLSFLNVNREEDLRRAEALLLQRDE